MGRKKLNSLERDVLDNAAGLNENITLTVYDKGESYFYRSRLLDINIKEDFIIIDEASVETPNAKPISKGQEFEVFFEFKGFRYLFNAEVLEHTKFKINNRGIYALKISLPTELKDGERREYFRVGLPMKPQIITSFNIFKREEKGPIMSTVIEDEPEVFEAVMVDISGGGFSIKAKDDSKILYRELDRGDVINAKFKLKPKYDEMELYSVVRNKHKYQDSEIMIWGLQFISGDKNKNLKKYRNKIMRFVIERQRELMSLS